MCRWCGACGRPATTRSCGGAARQLACSRWLPSRQPLCCATLGRSLRTRPSMKQVGGPEWCQAAGWDEEDLRQPVWQLVDTNLSLWCWVWQASSGRELSRFQSLASRWCQWLPVLMHNNACTAAQSKTLLASSAPARLFALPAAAQRVGQCARSLPPSALQLLLPRCRRSQQGRRTPQHGLCVPQSLPGPDRGNGGR